MGKAIAGVLAALLLVAATVVAAGDTSTATWSDNWFELNDISGLRTPAQTLVVAKSGGDYATIQAAINSISDNAPSKRYLIRIMPGLYTEQVTMKSWVDLRGAGKHASQVTFTGNDNGTIILASDVQVEDLLIEESASSTEWAIVGSNTSDVHIRNVDILGGGGDISQGIKITGNTWATLFIEHGVINYLGTTGYAINLTGNASAPQNIDTHIVDMEIDSFGATTGGSIRIVDTVAGRLRSSLVRTSAAGFDVSVDDTSAGTTDFLLDSTTLEFGTASLETDAGTTVLLKHSQVDSYSGGGNVVSDGSGISFGTLTTGAVVIQTDTIGANDTTPDVRGGSRFITSANTGATAITDLDTPTPGQEVCIVGGSNTNPSTIADSGNFNLSAAWTASLDDVLCLYVQADNYYIEVSRADN